MMSGRLGRSAGGATIQADLSCSGQGRCQVDRTIACDTTPDCAGQGPCERAGVFLERGAKLLLNGHTLAADATQALDFETVRCVGDPGRCTWRSG